MFIDLFVIALLLWAVFNGWRSGLIREVLGTLGIIIGLVLAGVAYWLGDDFLAVKGSQVNMVLSVIAFFILCIFIPLLLDFVAGRFTHFLKAMKLGLPNSLLGAAASVVKFVLLLSFAFNMMTQLEIMNVERTESSHLYQPLCDVLPFVGEQAGAQLDSLNMTVPVSANQDTIYVNFSHK